ncbi:hypothetical protein CEXT_482241 [Caerostris extrusa]|uniref:Uncharacterized protein n=1 Tax=Caerostris extrusa TaxID=172846 RepID=A0AAV4W5W7_CAEEX|nr:hypothetical protein CEXT_482241 [Caerostris extrusa]
MEINLNTLSVAGEDNCDLPESFTSSSYDLDQFSSWIVWKPPPTLQRPVPWQSRLETIQTSRKRTSARQTLRLSHRWLCQKVLSPLRSQSPSEGARWAEALPVHSMLEDLLLLEPPDYSQ